MVASGTGSTAVFNNDITSNVAVTLDAPRTLAWVFFGDAGTGTPANWTLDNGGNASRDFIHVRDMALGLIACALRGRAGEAYNLATGKETTILTLAQIINAATGNRTPPDLRPARDWDRSGKRFASTEKSANELDFRAATSIETGIAQTVDWTRQNLDLIRNCIARHEKLMRQAAS